jgi:hypothetical protein
MKAKFYLCLIKHHSIWGWGIEGVAEVNVELHPVPCSAAGDWAMTSKACCIFECKYQVGSMILS